MNLKIAITINDIQSQQSVNENNLQTHIIQDSGSGSSISEPIFNQQEQSDESLSYVPNNRGERRDDYLVDLIEGTGSTSQREMQMFSETVSAEGNVHQSFLPNPRIVAMPPQYPVEISLQPTSALNINAPSYRGISESRIIQIRVEDQESGEPEHSPSINEVSGVLEVVSLQLEEIKSNNKKTSSFEFDEEDSPIRMAKNKISSKKLGEKSTFFQQSKFKKQGDISGLQSDSVMPHLEPMSNSFSDQNINSIQLLKSALINSLQSKQEFNSLIADKRGTSGKHSGSVIINKQQLEIIINKQNMASQVLASPFSDELKRVETDVPKTFTPSLSTFTAHQKYNNHVYKTKTKTIIQSLTAKVKNLQHQLVNNKIFLNMVIDDMRNPTNSIEYAIKEVLRQLQSLNSMVNMPQADKKSPMDQKNMMGTTSWKQRTPNFKRVAIVDDEKIQPFELKTPEPYRDQEFRPMVTEEVKEFQQQSYGQIGDQIKSAQVFTFIDQNNRESGAPKPIRPLQANQIEDGQSNDGNKQNIMAFKFKRGNTYSATNQQRNLIDNQQQRPMKSYQRQMSEHRVIIEDEHDDDQWSSNSYQFEKVEIALKESVQEIIPDDECEELHSVPKMHIQNAYDQMKDYKYQINEEKFMSENNENLAFHSYLDHKKMLSSKSVMANQSLQKRIFIDLPASKDQVQFHRVFGFSHQPHYVHSNNCVENTIIEEIKDESKEEFPSVSDHNESQQKLFMNNNNDMDIPIMSSLNEYEKPIEESKMQPSPNQILFKLNTIQLNQGEDQKKSFNWIEQFRNSSALVNAFQIKQVQQHTNNNMGNVYGTPGSNGGILNSLFNGIANLHNRNENEIDMTDSQKGFLNELEIFMLQFQQKGIAIVDSKRQEIEILLKNSMFSSSMLLNLINDLLDLAKMENSSFTLNWNYFDLFEVIEKSAETLDSQLQQKNIFVSHQFHPDDRIYLKYIHGDQHRYLQILLNFMSNAVKFTPNGGKITIKTVLKDKQPVEEKLSDAQLQKAEIHYEEYILKRDADQQSENDGSGELSAQDSLPINNQSQLKQYYIDFQVHIIDTGCGISKENISKLFMNFSRLDEHTKMNQRGTGLGLSICKSLIELMGGKVTVESEQGKSTSFILDIKTKCRVKHPKMHQYSQIPQIKESGSGISQLLHNDSTDPPARATIQDDHQCEYYMESKTTKYLSQQRNLSFSKKQHQNERSSTLKQSEKHFMKIMSTNRFSQKRSGNLLKIRGATTSGFGKLAIMAIENIKNKGGDGSTKAKGQNRIETFNYANNQSGQVPYSNHSNRGDPEDEQIIPQFRALIANDDNFQIKITSRLLQQQAVFEIDEAENGLIAYEKYRDKRNEFELILLDLDMPIMSGYKACQMIRSLSTKDAGCAIKGLLNIDKESKLLLDDAMLQEDKSKTGALIIAYSGFVNDEVIQKCIVSGFNDVIEAPLTQEKVQTKIIDIIVRNKEREMNGKEEAEEIIIKAGEMNQGFLNSADFGGSPPGVDGLT